MSGGGGGGGGVAEVVEMEVRFKPPESFLPEGIQPVRLHSRPTLAGITIQVSKEEPFGGLWFHYLDGDRSTVYFSLEGHGRPGWFRPTTAPNQFVVGIEDRVCLVDVKEDDAGIDVHPLFTFNGIDAPRVTMNDGCVSPSNQLICGFKDAHFDLEKKMGVTKVLQADGKTVSTLASGEVCPNGNCFVPLDGVPHLLHIETPTKRLLAIPADQLSRDQPDARVLIDFGDREFFDKQRPGVWHEALLPDGMCCWKAGDTTRIAVSVFDFRPDTLRKGQVLQFSIDKASAVVLDAVYTTPGAPRTTHPAITRDESGTAQLWTTTADEGLLQAMGASDQDTSHVGACFSITLPAAFQPDADNVDCNLPYRVPEALL